MPRHQRHIIIAVVVALVAVVFVGSASADRIRYLALDRIDETNAATVDVAMLGFTDSGQSARRVDIAAHISGAHGFGGYFALPVVFSTIPDKDKNTTIGGAQLGAFYVRSFTVQEEGRLTTIGRAGAILPTASSTLRGMITNSLNGHARIADLPAIFADTTWGRASGSVEYRKGALFGRVDLGVDVPLSSPDTSDPETLYRFGFGGGVRARSFAVSVELMNVRFAELPWSHPSGTHHSVAAGIHFPSDSLTLSLAVVAPVQETNPSTVRSIFLAGIRAPLP
jgi:hypothetical protein